MKHGIHYSGGCGHLHESMKDAMDCLMRDCVQLLHLNGRVARVRKYELMEEDWEDLLHARRN